MIVQSHILDKKAAILKSTLELVKNNGFHATPISLIAKNAGVAAGTIYHYFSSKDDIILELYEKIRKEMAAVMFTKTSNQKDYREQFFNGWMALCKYFIKNPSCLLFLEQFNSSPFSKIAVGRDKKTAPNAFNAFFQDGIDKGYLKDLEYMLIASAVFGCIMATAKYHITGRFGFTDTDLCKMATILWDGIKAQ